MRVTEAEYIWIECAQCDERVKLAKNKGSEWKTFSFLQDFLLQHSDCHKEDVFAYFTS